MLKRLTLNVFDTLRSSWLMRSPYSVIGATSGTFKEACVMPGSTRAPAVHLACATQGELASYRVVGKICHTVDAPAGAASCAAVGAPLGPDTPVRAPTEDVPNR